MDKRAGHSGVHFLHISKTGGTSFKHILRERSLRTSTSGPMAGTRIYTHHHALTMPETLVANPANKVVFFLRDPISRFVSGFNTRLRQGLPARDNPWRPEEVKVFAQFTSPNDLAEGLSSDDLTRQDWALTAMRTIVHTRMHYTRWLHSVPYLEARLDRIMFIGFQESYDEDVRRFFELFGVAREVEVERQHIAPSSQSNALSELAVENLRTWYAEDFVIDSWARSQRARFHEG